MIIIMTYVARCQHLGGTNTAPFITDWKSCSGLMPRLIQSCSQTLTVLNQSHFINVHASVIFIDKSNTMTLLYE